MDWAAQKAAAQRQVHSTFAVRCIYRETSESSPVNLFARLHSRMMVGGSEGAGYATIIEGVTHVVFNKEQLIASNVIPKRDAFVTFPDYSQTFVLDMRDPRAGPVVEKWSLGGT